MVHAHYIYRWTRVCSLHTGSYIHRSKLLILWVFFCRETGFIRSKKIGNKYGTCSRYIQMHTNVCSLHIQMHAHYIQARTYMELNYKNDINSILSFCRKTGFIRSKKWEISVAHAHHIYRRTHMHALYIQARTYTEVKNTLTLFCLSLIKCNF